MSDNGSSKNVTYILKIGNSESSSVCNSYYDGDDSLHPARNSLSSALSSSPSTASSNNERRAKDHVMDKRGFCTANRKGHQALAVLKFSFVNFSRGTPFAIILSHFYPLLPSTLTTSQLWSCHPAPTIACHFHAYKYPRYFL